jgi:hypothetical protein
MVLVTVRAPVPGYRRGATEDYDCTRTSLAPMGPVLSWPLYKEHLAFKSTHSTTKHWKV